MLASYHYLPPSVSASSMEADMSESSESESVGSLPGVLKRFRRAMSTSLILRLSSSEKQFSAIESCKALFVFSKHRNSSGGVNSLSKSSAWLRSRPIRQCE